MSQVRGHGFTTFKIRVLNSRSHQMEFKLYVVCARNNTINYDEQQQKNYITKIFW